MDGARFWLNTPDPAPHVQKKFVRRAHPAMGTLFEILVEGKDEEHLAAAALAALEEVHRVERLLSKFDPRSEIYRINKRAYHEPVLVDREVANLLDLLLRWNEYTAGMLDIAARPDAGPYPLDNVEFDLESRRVRFLSPNTQLDLGALGKGYALDCAAAVLQENNVFNAFLHGGTSSVVALGRPYSGCRWCVGVGDPFFPGREAVDYVEIEDQSLAISAARHPGQTMSDIISPKTGQPLKHNVACLAVGRTGLVSEAMSTAMLVMGRGLAKSWLFCNQAELSLDRFPARGAWITRCGKRAKVEWFDR